MFVGIKISNGTKLCIDIKQIINPRNKQIAVGKVFYVKLKHDKLKAEIISDIGSTAFVTKWLATKRCSGRPSKLLDSLSELSDAAPKQSKSPQVKLCNSKTTIVDTLKSLEKERKIPSIQHNELKIPYGAREPLDDVHSASTKFKSSEDSSKKVTWSEKNLLSQDKRYYFQNTIAMDNIRLPQIVDNRVVNIDLVHKNCIETQQKQKQQIAKLEGEIEAFQNADKNKQLSRNTEKADLLQIHKEKQQLVEENDELRRSLQDANTEISNQQNEIILLKSENASLRKQLEIAKISALEASDNIEERCENVFSKESYNLSTGYVEESAIYLGENWWMKLETYNGIKNSSKTSSQFVSNVTLAVFGPVTLKRCTITGRKSNRNKTNVRDKLEETKVEAIESIHRYYLEKEIRMTRDQLKKECSLTKKYIMKKSSELKRGPRKTRPKKASRNVQKGDRNPIESASNEKTPADDSIYTFKGTSESSSSGLSADEMD